MFVIGGQYKRFDVERYTNVLSAGIRFFSLRLVETRDSTKEVQSIENLRDEIKKTSSSILPYKLYPSVETSGGLIRCALHQNCFQTLFYSSYLAFTRDALMRVKPDSGPGWSCVDYVPSILKML